MIYLTTLSVLDYTSSIDTTISE